MSATVVATISICFLASACHTAASAAGHTNPTLPSSPVSATTPAPETTAPASTAPGATSTDSTTPDATATAGAVLAGGCLINSQEASAAFGHPAGAGSGDAGTCTYQTAGGILSVFASTYGNNAMTAFTSQRQAATGLPGFQDVNGVGDHAFVSLDDPMSLIEFVHGSTIVVIQLGISPSPPLSVMTTLGQAADGRL